MCGFVIGEGSYGKVKEAVDTKQKIRVALKIIKYNKLKKIQGGADAVKSEIKMLNELDHPNIVKFYDSFEILDKGKIYVVLELVEGGSLQSLADRAPNKRLSARQTRPLFKQLFRALDYVHQCKIVHRDVKPDNMMLTMDGVLQLLDFGVAVRIGQEEETVVTGSPAFQPPEVASGKLTFSGPAMDMWSAGVCLFMVTQGRFPFEANSPYAMFERIAAAEYTLDEEILSADLCSLIRGLMDVNQETRFTVAKVKKHPWMTKKMKKPATKEEATAPVPLKRTRSAFTDDEVAAAKEPPELDNARPGATNKTNDPKPKVPLFGYDPNADPENGGGGDGADDRSQTPPPRTTSPPGNPSRQSSSSRRRKAHHHHHHHKRSGSTGLSNNSSSSPHTAAAESPPATAEALTNTSADSQTTVFTDQTVNTSEENVVKKSTCSLM